MKVLISNAIENERLPSKFEKSDIVYGKAHYSWKIIARMYQQALAKIHVDARAIVSPDIYQAPEARKVAGINVADLHISVKPIEYIRPIFGIRNFFVCGWEFPEFSKRPINNNPANNYISTLKRADKILCWSSYTENNIKKYGIDDVVSLPPPVVSLMKYDSVSVKDIRCIFHSGSAEYGFEYCDINHVKKTYRNIFFNVMNPWDRRKNIVSLIQGFSEYDNISNSNDSALVIKLVVDNVVTRAENIIEILSSQYGIESFSENIFFIGENLSEEEMAGFYTEFDFYMCASSTEGLNLPLIEAMAFGMVPISTAATAMQDYITKDNAIVLPAKRMSADAQFSALGDTLALSHFPPSQKSIAIAFEKAAGLPPRERRNKARKAKETVEKRYGLARFETDFFTAIGGR